MSHLGKIVKRNKKRLGRGYGSGRGGHTVGRGTKGQKSRTKTGILFEGMKVKKSLLKRLPLRRGKGKFKAGKKPLVVKIDYLNLLPAGSKVDLNLLVKHGIVKKDEAIKFGVKILGKKEVKKKLIVLVPISGSAAKMIEEAGGKIIKDSKIKEKNSKPRLKSKS